MHGSTLEELAMKINEGGADRAIRVVVGLALIALAATHVVGVWGYIGVVPLLTGLIGICPAYSLLGMNTCPMKGRQG
jgi:fatty acid desaturase